MIRKVMVGIAVATVGAAVYFEVRDGVFSGFFRPVTVAVLDTGVDARIPAIALRLSVIPGRNYFDNNMDVADQDGHGTKVALAVLSECAKSDCRILPIKMTKNGVGATPKETAAAIRYAVEAGVRVVNISYGMSAGSPDLEAALGEARARGAVVVAAAGTGILNPFRAEPLSKVYPQSYPDILVVGAARSLDEPDIAMNFGPELDAVAIGQPGDSFGSSYAAASVSGIIADVLRHFPKLTPERIRARMRELAREPRGFRSETGELSGVPDKLGFGAVDPERLHKAGMFTGDSGPAWRQFWNLQGELDVELSSEYNITDAHADWDCGPETTAQRGAFGLEALVLKKGRARVMLKPGTDKSRDADLARSTLLNNCRLKLSLAHHDERHGDFSENLSISVAKK